MPAGPLKHVGEYPLVVALHPDVTANITVRVIGETVAGNLSARVHVVSQERARRRRPFSFLCR